MTTEQAITVYIVRRVPIAAKDIYEGAPICYCYDEVTADEIVAALASQDGGWHYYIEVADAIVTTSA